MKKKKMMSDLPKDIEEEVLCRIPLTSLGVVRSTCKRWHRLSRCVANKHLAHLAAAEAKKKDHHHHHALVVMMMNYRVQLMRLNLCNEEDVVVVNPEAKLIGLDEIDVREILHCNGLLLCIPKEDHSRLLVWNPYWGRQPRWIEHTHNYDLVNKHLFGCLDSYTYGLGYNSSTGSHKILRLIDYPPNFVEFKIYDFNSDSWRILDLLPPRRGNWNIYLCGSGASLKGNTYWIAAEAGNDDAISFLVCFDFTRETFSPPLPLPVEAFLEDTLSLSSTSVGELVVLFQYAATLMMEMWISNTIEQPNGVSWNSKVFLSANIKQLIDPQWQFLTSSCFFIDQEKKVAVVFDKEDHMDDPSREIAYIFRGGVDGSSLKKQVVKESTDLLCFSRVCYYVPSLVQLN